VAVVADVVGGMAEAPHAVAGPATDVARRRPENPDVEDARPQPTWAPDERLFGLEPDRLAPTMARLTADGWRLATLVATDDRREGRGFGVEGVVVRAGAPILRLRAELPAEAPAYPSIGRVLPAALWDERELHDLLGIVPVGHPDLRRLVLHDAFPDGYHPLRHDAPSTPPEGVAATPYRPFVAHGEGVYELPVGPIHAGVIEPGHFRFSAMGESILYLDARLFFTHRGVEKLVEDRTVEAALAIVERTCGVCTVTHATAFSLAVERLAGSAADPPPRAVALRAVLAEMERLYNHIGDLGNICAGIGFNVGSSQLGWLKEQALRLNEGLVGHRYLMGIVAPGGLAYDIAGETLAALPRRLAALETDLDTVLSIVDRTDAAWDRFRHAGVLPRSTAEVLGTVGVAARASGIGSDLRADLPTGVYRRHAVTPEVAAEGDVAARFAVRRREIAASFGLLQVLLADLPAGDVRTPLPALPAGASALGWAEGPRGASWVWLRLGSDGRVDRMRLRSASLANWPAVAAAAADNLVPDFPLINKSFELCYACTDR
jgi:Ni,Fe-hydrogenase III large subunit/Ni,Fe-hydrogenase III component G